jgi:GDP-L-fucose synthase
MKILVTGSSGFLGKYVMSELNSRGYDTIGLNSTDVNLTHEGLNNFLIFEDRHNRLDVVSHIIHLAAFCGGIGINKKKPAEFFEKNVLINMNVLNSWRDVSQLTNRKIKLICVGSVCSYPKHCSVPFKEEDIWKGYPEETNASYGLAKRMMMEQMRAYKEQYGLSGIFLIPVNLFGPHDHFDLENSHVIPALIRKFHEAKLENKNSVEIWGTGKACREFLYAGEAARGIVGAMEKYDGDEPINLGTGDEISIEDLVNMIRKKVDFNGDIEWNTSMPDGQPRRCLDVSKSLKYFGFRSNISLNEGLDKTIEWYITNREEILLKGDI